MKPMRQTASVIHGVISQGEVGAFCGEKGGHRTWALIEAALAVSTGSEWWHFRTTAQKVLHVNADLRESFLYERISRVAAAKGVSRLPTLDILSWRGKGDFSQMLQAIDERANDCGLIIIDSAAAGLTGTVEQFRDMAKRTGAAILFDWYASRPLSREPDCLLTLGRHDAEGIYTVCATRKAGTTSAFPLQWHYPAFQTAPLPALA